MIIFNLITENDYLAKGYATRVLKLLVPDPVSFKRYCNMMVGDSSEELFRRLEDAVLDARQTESDQDLLDEINNAFALVATIIESTVPLSPDGLVPWIPMPDVVGTNLNGLPSDIAHACDVKYLWGGTDDNIIVAQSVEAGFKYPGEGWTVPAGKCDIVVGYSTNKRADYETKDGVVTKLKFYTEDHGDGTYTVDCKKRMTYEELTAVKDEAVADLVLVDGVMWCEIYKCVEYDIYSWYNILTDMHIANGG